MGLSQQKGKGGEEGNNDWNDFWKGIANINPWETVTALPFIKSLTDLFTKTTPQQDTSNQTTQSKQEEIKQQLTKEIEKDAPAETETNTQVLLEHKVKNLTAIFLELKYQKIDEILNRSTSAQDKIQEIKKFQGRFNLDLPITDKNKLDTALYNLSRDIEKEGLNLDQVTSSSTKFTPISYTLTELQYHSIHSKHYLDGILQGDEIDAEKRITASKLFVKQLELVSETQKSAMAGKHKQFVQYKVEEFSYDTKKIVAAGAEFAKSIEALTSGDKPTSFLGADGRVLTGSQGHEYHFHDSVVKDEVHQRDLVIRKFKERLSSLSSALGSETKIDKAKTDKIFDNTKITYGIVTNKITFKDPKPPVGAAGGGADAAAGAGGGAGGQSGDATATAANPLTDISFVGLSNEDIFRRSFYVRYAIEGIMEVAGNDEDKKKL